MAPRPVYVLPTSVINEVRQVTGNGSHSFYKGYEVIYQHIRNANIDQETKYWFEQARGINRGSGAASLFIRTYTNNGLSIAGKSPRDMNQVTNAIGREVIQGVLESGGIADLSIILRDDIQVAFDFGVTGLGGWGGSFFYWNIPRYDAAGNNLGTIGQSILADEVQKDLFIKTMGATIADVAKNPRVWFTIFGDAGARGAIASIANLPTEIQNGIIREAAARSDLLKGALSSLTGQVWGDQGPIPGLVMPMRYVQGSAGEQAQPPLLTGAQWQAFEDYMYAVGLAATNNGRVDSDSFLESMAQLAQKFAATVPEAFSYLTASTVAEMFGSTLGRQLAGRDLAGGVVAGSLLGAIALNVGQALDARNGVGVGVSLNDGSVLEDVRLSANQVWQDFPNELRNFTANASIGAVSSYLTMELGNAIGAKGFGAEMFSAGVSPLLNRVVTNLASNLPGLEFLKPQLAGPWSPGTALASSFVSFFATKLGSMVVSPETQAGAVLSSLGSSLGGLVAAKAFGALAWSTAGTASAASAGLIGQSAAWFGNVFGRTVGGLVFPGVGIFIGFVIGALVGNLFGKKKPKTPSASAEVYLELDEGEYELASPVQYANGNTDLAKDMGASARDTLNAMINLVARGQEAVVANTFSPSQWYGHTGNNLWVATGSLSNKTFVQSADEAVDKGVLYALPATKITGGDILLKRALQNVARHPARIPNVAVLAGDLQVAEDYGYYLKNRSIIEGLIAEPWSKLSDAEKAFFAGNEAFMTRFLSRAAIPLSQDDQALYQANQNLLDGIQSKLDLTPFAAGWIVTLSRAAELGLEQSSTSDFHGGLRGFVNSFTSGRAAFNYEEIRVHEGRPAPPDLGGNGAFVVFAGQSNMGGYAMSSANRNANWRPDPLTKIWNQATQTWVQMDPGVNTGYSSGALQQTWGPEVNFAINFRATFPNEPLYIVKSVHGGTTLAVDWSPTVSGSHFHSTGAIIDQASGALNGRRPDSLMWGQGETDAENINYANAYSSNLKTFFEAARAEWLSGPNSLIGYFRINTSPAHDAEVRAAQAAVDQADQRAFSFDANGFPRQGLDELHFSNVGLDSIGRSFFDIFAQWHGAIPQTPGPGAPGQVITSDQHADTLIGTPGNDTLNSGVTADTMTGGDGADEFVFPTVPWSPARITDFEVGVDKINLSALLPSGYSGDPLADGWVAVFAEGSDTKVVLDPDGPGGPQLYTQFVTYLTGVAHTQLTGADFRPGVSSNPGAPGQVITSDQHADTLIGTAGNDTLNSGVTADTMTGGDGSDRFVFATVPWSPARITDFEVGVDKIDLSALLPSGYSGDPLADGWVAVFAEGSDTKMVLDPDGPGGPELYTQFVTYLTGVAHTQLTGADFRPGVSSNPPGSGDQLLEGTGSADTLTGGSGNDTLNGNAGDDSLVGGLGADRITGGDGGDAIITSSNAAGTAGEAGDYAHGNIGADIIVGGHGSDTLIGGQDNDTITGGSGDDYLSGDRGANELAGGLGNDTLNAGFTNDILSGSGGSDVFRFAMAPWSPARITDFEIGVDKIDISALLPAGYSGDPLAEGWIALYNDGPDTKVVLDPDGPGGPELYTQFVTYLSGVTASSLDGSDFIGYRPPAASSMTAASPASASLMSAAEEVGVTISINSSFPGARGFFSGLPNSTADGTAVVISDFLTGATGYTPAGPTGMAGNNYRNETAATVGQQIVDEGTDASTGGDDIFIGSQFGDSIHGRTGWDWLDGGAGADTIQGGQNPDVVLGGSGGDLLMGDADADYVSGGEGNDTVEGGTGADTLVGNTGLDSLIADDGDDVLLADEGDGGAADTLNGGAGVDAVSFERHSAAITADLRNGGHLGDVWIGIEGLVGSRHHDQLWGDAQQNRLDGYDGDDTLRGEGGDDTLEGGAGADRLEGGEGINTLSYRHSTEGVYVDLGTQQGMGGDAEGDTFDGIRNLIGSRFGDELDGDDLDNVISAGKGDDWILATRGNDTYDGGEGIDFVDYSTAAAGVIVNLGSYSGTSASSGTASQDGFTHQLTSIEAVVGSTYSDQMSGGSGEQIFAGGKGDDFLSGGADADTYAWNRGDGYDVIDEVETGWNKLTFGDGILFSDLRLGTAGGADGLLEVRVLGDTGGVRVNGNWANANVPKIKALEVGSSRLDLEAGLNAPWADETDNTMRGSDEFGDLMFGYGGNDVMQTRQHPYDVDYVSHVLVGGTGDDWMSSSAGHDQYAMDRGDGVDTIGWDHGGEDTVVFGPSVALEDVIWEIDGDDMWIGVRDVDDPNRSARNVSTRLLVVGGAIEFVAQNTGLKYYRIERIEAGGGSIDLRQAQIPWSRVQYTQYDYVRPIVFDLDGDGLDLSTVDASSVVARTENGILSKVAWVGPTEGFLAYDRDGDGSINRLSELSFTQDVAGARTDLEGLRGWDTNGDMVLDSKDSGWGKLRIWVDKNQNGRSTKAELRTLDELGITSIDLKGEATGYAPDLTTESLIHHTIAYKTTSGSGTAYDLSLARRLINSEDVYAGEYQQSWGSLNEDGTLGRLTNNPKVEAAKKNGKQPNDTTLLERLLPYEQVAAEAKIDYRDTDEVDPAVAEKWAYRLDPKAKAEHKKGETAPYDPEHLKKLAAGDRKTAEKSGTAFQSSALEDHGGAEASGPSQPNPGEEGGRASMVLQGENFEPSPISRRGEVELPQRARAPLPATNSVAGSESGPSHDWWRLMAPDSLTAAASLEVAGQARSWSGVAAAGTESDPSAGETIDLLRQQLLLQQSIAAFTPDAGGSAPVWRQAEIQPRLDLALDARAAA